VSRRTRPLSAFASSPAVDTTSLLIAEESMGVRIVFMLQSRAKLPQLPRAVLYEARVATGLRACFPNFQEQTGRDACCYA
jgi:hypothetical protein